MITLFQYPSHSEDKSYEVLKVFLRMYQHSSLSNINPIVWDTLTFIYLFIEHKPLRFEEKQQATQVLLQLVQRADLSVGQTIQAAEALYRSSLRGSKEKQQATQVLLQLVQRADLSIEQTTQVAEALYRSSLDDSEEQRQATQVLLQLVQRADLSIEQTIQAAEALYRSNPRSSEREQQPLQILWHLAQDKRITPEQHLYIIMIPIKTYRSKYLDKIHAVQELLTLLSIEEAKEYLTREWQISVQETEIEEIPYVAEIVTLEVLPAKIRDRFYSSLISLVPFFDKIPMMKK